MSKWPSSKARKVVRALQSIGWKIKRERGTSHKVMERLSWPDFVFAFHDGDEIGPRMLARISKSTGLKPSDL
ncbi:type II toxin-antitoxin system HicA family toxin [Opitutales bacterium]|nr:type II toxin-antitoxin system HicA family toxin [Opitutales bacterium]